MITSDKKAVQSFVQACVNAGLKNVVCSPGSRNSPLVIAFDEHPSISCLLIHDERSAAFVAMGMSQELNEPVAVLCTSGSAMLNYYPAVAESYYQRIPLLVISADRPEEWINQGDGQTIMQRGVYQNHIEGESHFNELMEDYEIEQQTYALFEKCYANSKGPIHINFALNEPLYQTVEINEPEINFKTYEPSKNKLTNQQIKFIKKGLNFPKKLVLIGQMPKNPHFTELLKTLSEDTSFAILVENTSNLASMKWCQCIDRTLQSIHEYELDQFLPDLLITFGGAIVSKRIKSFLRKNKPKQHWKVGNDFPEMNTYRALTHSFEINEATFLHHLLSLKSELPLSNFGSKWKQKDFITQDKGAIFLETAPFSDLKAIEVVLDCIPEQAHIHMGNSSIVRYCQLFNPIPSMSYFSNRGTSGIDGSLSTVVGAAIAKPNTLHVAILGDISFFYDSNALWNKYSLDNLRIIVLNNGGGGIFNIIEGPSSVRQNEHFFEAKQAFKAEKIAEAFGVTYYSASNEEELVQCMSDFYAYETSGAKLLEVDTATIDNHLVLKSYFKSLV